MDVLNAAAARGDADALLTLALWTLSGQRVRRNLPVARELFRLAAEAGSFDARTIHTAFIANGTGGSRDWRGAISALREVAEDDAQARRQIEIIDRMSLTDEGDPTGPVSSKQLSASPKVELFPKLFSPAECRYLLEAAEPFYQPSLVVDPASGRQIRNPQRTSDVAGFPLMDENPTIHALNRRLALASGTSPDQGEPLQILRYRVGQEYKPHSDALLQTDNQRVRTVLVYLNDDFQGGETYFPAADLKVRGEPGDALLFVNAAADGRPDPAALHAGLPVTGGVKIIASRWIRARPLDLSARAA